MPIVSLILLVAQYLPTIIGDLTAVTTVLDTSSAAIKAAQAGDGTISAADWAALDAATNADLAALAAAAGIAVPATV
jgi:hypothetical protein